MSLLYRCKRPSSEILNHFIDYFRSVDTFQRRVVNAERIPVHQWKRNGQRLEKEYTPLRQKPKNFND